MQNKVTDNRRTMAEYITSRLVQLNFKASEVKLRKTLYIKKESGEFLLSRDINALGSKYQAQAVIVGTYSIGKYVVYISLRLVEADSNVILATSEFEIPLGAEAKRLLYNDQL